MKHLTSILAGMCLFAAATPVLAQDVGIVFCAAKALRYSGGEFALQLVRRGDSYVGQVIDIKMSGHPNILGTKVAFEEPVQEVNATQATFSGAKFQLTFDSNHLPNFDDRVTFDVNGSSSSDFTSLGISRFWDNRPSQFGQLVCRKGSYLQRIAIDPIMDWSDEFAN
jgi:hypothetical protein